MSAHTIYSSIEDSLYPIGEWSTIGNADPSHLSVLVARKLEHDIGRSTSAGGLIPVPHGGVQIRRNADGSIDIKAEVWLPGKPVVFNDEFVTRPREYRSILQEATR